MLPGIRARVRGKTLEREREGRRNRGEAEQGTKGLAWK
jgi:hypothetical protein